MWGGVSVMIICGRDCSSFPPSVVLLTCVGGGGGRQEACFWLLFLHGWFMVGFCQQPPSPLHVLTPHGHAFLPPSRLNPACTGNTADLSQDAQKVFVFSLFFFGVCCAGIHAALHYDVWGVCESEFSGCCMLGPTCAGVLEIFRGLADVH